MFLDLENPYEVLKKAGYTMDGESNSFRLMIGETLLARHAWFHAYVQHDEKSITLHLDRSNSKNIENAKKKHKTVQRGEGIEREAKRIKSFESVSVMNLTDNLRLAAFVWVLRVILPLVPKSATKTLNWLTGIPKE